MIDLEGIISISGKPGLYRLLKGSSKGMIIESIESGKRFPVDPHNSISRLDEVQIYTEDGELPLGELFAKIHEKEGGGRSIDHRSSKEDLIEKFEEILPEYDKESVYPSDIKKCFQWYNLLHENDALNFKEEDEEGESKEEGKDESKEEEE